MIYFEYLIEQGLDTLLNPREIPIQEIVVLFYIDEALLEILYLKRNGVVTANLRFVSLTSSS